MSLPWTDEETVEGAQCPLPASAGACAVSDNKLKLLPVPELSEAEKDSLW